MINDGRIERGRPRRCPLIDGPAEVEARTTRPRPADVPSAWGTKLTSFEPTRQAIAPANFNANTAGLYFLSLLITHPAIEPSNAVTALTGLPTSPNLLIASPPVCQ